MVEFADTRSKHGLKAKKSKKNYKSKKELTVKFDRQAVRGLIKNPSKKMIMKVQGDLLFHTAGDSIFRRRQTKDQNEEGKGKRILKVKRKRAGPKGLKGSALFYMCITAF